MNKSKIIQIQEDLEMYPNLLNEQLPFTARCSEQDGELPFIRCCPRIFDVKSANLRKGSAKPICMWEVEYVLKNGEDLPQPGPGLEFLVDCLKRYRPDNTYLKEVGIHLPKIIKIYDYIVCECSKLDFELATRTPTLWQPNRHNLAVPFGSLKISSEEDCVRYN